MKLLGEWQLVSLKSYSNSLVTLDVLKLLEGWACRPRISGVKIQIPSTWKAVGDLKV